jgi:tetratricopeptide (TPR) repeat protein
LLDAVPRSSIFAPWKLAIRAIAAVYQEDFQTAKKNIAAIPDSSRVHALVPILADMAGTPNQSLGVAEKSLQKATGSLRQRFASILGQLEKAVKAGNPEAISRALEEIHDMLPALPNAARPVILATLLSNLDENEVEPELLEKSLFSGKLRGELHRFLALEGEEGSAPFFSVVFWGKYLDFAYSRKLFSEQSLETALILLRINHLLLQDELYGDAAAGLDETTRRLLASGNSALFDREKVLERVLAIRPFSEAFSSLLDIYLEREEEEQALLVAEQWCQRSPNDARPWRYRTGVMAMRGQSDLAMKLIDEAMEKNPFEPSFRELRFFGFVERLGGLIRKGAPGVTETLAECRRQAGAISDQAHLFISAVEWVLAQRVKGQQKKGDVEATERFRTECGNDHLARILAMTAEQWAGSTLTRPDWKEGEALDGYIRALGICHSLHAQPRVPVEFLVDLEKSLPTASTRQLLAIVRTSQVPDHGDFPRLIHAAILEGLTRRDETCGIFLAMAVSTTPSRRKSSAKALLKLKRVMGFLLETHPQAEGTEDFRGLVDGLRGRIGFDSDRAPSPSEIERCVVAEIKKLELFLNVPKARKRKGSPENNEFF